jgi:hypothetical protein
MLQRSVTVSGRFQKWINLFLAIALRLKEMSSTLFVYTEENTVGL